jgi:squalene synthase HpnC
MIPGEKRKYIFAIYAFARQADDYADEPGIGSVSERLELINLWNKKLNDCNKNEAEEPVFIALSQTVKDCNIPVEPLENLLKAFRQDVIKNRYKDFDEVLSYCENSANPIGRLVLMVYGCKDDEFFYYSDKICTALQLTNFWQDIKIDLEKDRIYIPLDDMLRFNYSEQELTGFQYNDNFRELMQYEAERTEKMFDEGAKLIEHAHKDPVLHSLASELKLILLGGRLILKKLKEIKYDIFEKRPVITGIDKIKLFSKSKLL